MYLPLSGQTDSGFSFGARPKAKQADQNRGFLEEAKKILPRDGTVFVEIRQIMIYNMT